MYYGSSARTAAGGTRPTVYGRRRRRVLLAAGFVLVVAATALATARRPPGEGHLVLPAKHRPYDERPALGWPQQGQAAFVLAGGRPAASPHQRPAPIASLAKVMTAYLTLERYPLSGRQEGFTIDVTAAEAEAETREAAQGQSVVAVRAGEQLTERQLLEALLIPSANNVASMLAGLVAGSETRFVAEMNAEAVALGMDDTTYTDPSGFDPNTVSTAADQLRVFQQATRFPVFRQIVSMASVTLPVVGTVRNFDPLIAEGYAGKTGSDSAAGGCFAFFTRVRAGERWLTVVGVVMGQGRGSDTSAILAAAGDAAEQLVDQAVGDRRLVSHRPSRRPSVIFSRSRCLPRTHPWAAVWASS